MDVYFAPGKFNGDGTYNVQDLIDKINRVKAGENVPGVTVFDGDKLINQIKPGGSGEELKSPSLITIGLVGLLVYILFPKPKKKRDS
ncbi:MAG TPA: hypothetical protein VGN64_06740 [Dyadobacter sp.]|jgi:hypothetical protein|nr:hypothetical protein [Dyadobacter sp.]